MLCGAVCDQLGDVDTAITYYERSLKILETRIDQGCDITMLRECLGDLYCRLGRFQEALEQMELVVQVEMEFAIGYDRWMNIAAALNRIGMVLNIQGKYEESIKQCHRALELVKKSSKGNVTGLLPLIQHTIGVAHLQQRKFRAAVKHFEMALRGNEEYILPDNQIAAIHTGLGAALWGVGDLCNAKDNLRKSLRLTPEKSPELQPRVELLRSLLKEISIVQGQVNKHASVLVRFWFVIWLTEYPGFEIKSGTQTQGQAYWGTEWPPEVREEVRRDWTDESGLKRFAREF